MAKEINILAILYLPNACCCWYTYTDFFSSPPVTKAQK